MNDSPKEMRKLICEQGVTLSLMEAELLASKEEIAKLDKQRQVAISAAEEFEARAIQAEQELAKLKRDDKAFRETSAEIQRASIEKHNAWWQMREERNALLEGLKWYADKERYKLTVHIRNYRQYESIVQTDEGSHARSIIAKLEGSKPDDAR